MEPRISIVIVSYNAVKTIEDCLVSLEPQVKKPHAELIVIDSSDDGTDRLIKERFPWAKLHHFSERRYPGDARNEGIRVARGELIAFIDADCVAADDWLVRIEQSHRGRKTIIGGAIGNHLPSNHSGWAAYFCEFSRWMPGSGKQVMDEVPTANVSYKKEIFECMEPFIEGTYCSDTVFHWRAVQAGYTVHFDPSIRVFHQGIDRLGSLLRHEFDHGKSFAGVRVRYQRFSIGRRLLYAGLFKLIALKLMVCITFRNLKNRVYLKQLTVVYPLVWLSVFAWSLGEAAGYLPGRRERK